MLPPADACSSSDFVSIVSLTPISSLGQQNYLDAPPPHSGSLSCMPFSAFQPTFLVCATFNPFRAKKFNIAARLNFRDMRGFLPCLTLPCLILTYCCHRTALCSCPPVHALDNGLSYGSRRVGIVFVGRHLRLRGGSESDTTDEDDAGLDLLKQYLDRPEVPTLKEVQKEREERNRQW